MNHKKKTLKQKIWLTFILLSALYIVLSIPLDDAPEAIPAHKQPFTWDKDQYWEGLENAFQQARQADKSTLQTMVAETIAALDADLDQIEGNTDTAYPPDAEIFTRLETNIFKAAPPTAALGEVPTDYILRCNRIRSLVKKQSRTWDLEQQWVRHRMYRLLYGTRAALEEVMLQTTTETLPDLVTGDPAPSQTPAAALLGITIHSGDILVSRGGAPTSALIARGNDYPGNFSHIALVHVDPKTFLPSIIEAHIEVGTVITDPIAYIKDKKHRVMVLRPRPDLPQIIKDPLLPHKAATAALEETKKRHIPYDFQMDYTNPEKMFCSEVASAAYKTQGLSLWMGMSHISSPGLASWLGAFGVEHFETQEPSDLEYDHQLTVVAEWRDRDTLYQDHLDNAVTDVMLEGAEKGNKLKYNLFALAPARLMKLYSVIMNQLGSTGPIPEGMSATAALKNKRFSEVHQTFKEQLILKADAFKRAQGYTPPYWKLVQMARSIHYEH